MSKVLTSVTSLALAPEGARLSSSVQSASDERFKALLRSYEFAPAKSVAQASSEPPHPVNTIKTIASTSDGGRARVSFQGAAVKTNAALSKRATSKSKEGNGNPKVSFEEACLKPKGHESGSAASRKAVSNSSAVLSRPVCLPFRNLPKDSEADSGVPTESGTSETVDEREADNPKVLTAVKSSAVFVADAAREVNGISAGAYSERVQEVASGPAPAASPEGTELNRISPIVQDGVEIALPVVLSSEAENRPEISGNSSNVIEQPIDETKSIPLDNTKESSLEVEENHTISGDTNTIIYQVFKGNTSTTHIEMAIGAQQTVHVEIGSATDAKHSIRIDTDSGDMFHALQSRRDDIISALRQSSFPLNDVQSFIPLNAQVQVGVLTAFSSENENGDRQRPNGARPSKDVASQVNRLSSTREETTRRREINGVIDLTV